MTHGCRMGREIHSEVRRLYRDENGAVAVLVAISIVVMLGLIALAVDIGSLVFAQRTLQATTDVAALAGAQDIGCSGGSVPGCVAGTAITTANNYSAMSGSQNAQTGLTVTMASGYPTLTCLTYTDINYNSSTGKCTGVDAANAIIVKQQATVPLLFAPVFGFNPTITLSATSFASKATGAFPPLNVMLVIDNTASMNTTDPTNVTCGGITHATRLDCALSGAQIFLSELWPTLDNVGLMVFPGVNNTTSATDDASCSSSLKSSVQVAPYSPIPVYQIAPASGLLNDYKTSNATSSLNISSKLVTATCQSGMTTTSPLTGSTVETCGTCAGLDAKGGQGTYYAGAINAAQQALTANSQPGVQNVIILLSDGGAGNGTTLGSVETSAETPVGSSTLHFASVPAAVIPGTSVADTTTSPNDTTVIPAGTSVVSTTATTVTISNPVVAVATATTNKATAAGSVILNFSAVPAAVQAAGGVGLTVADKTNPSAIPTGTTVVSATATTVTISKAVTGVTAATVNTNAATAAGLTTLHFASVPATVKSGMAVADTTAASAIPAGTAVVSTTATTVTISNPVADTTNVTDTTTQSSRRGQTTKTLTFASVPATVKVGMTVTDSLGAIPAGTTVSSTTATTVVISVAVTETSGDVITFSGGGVANGDTITFSNGGVASGDIINFGDVKDADTISFGSNNQCHEGIAAAQAAIAAGTWIYSIAYGATTNTSSCSDTETPPISSCATMQQIASDATKFYSDPMGQTPVCTSPDNPSATDIGTIFAAIGNSLRFTQTVSATPP
jgi:Flp pilus assembly protein TadG